PHVCGDEWPQLALRIEQVAFELGVLFHQRRQRLAYRRGLDFDHATLSRIGPERGGNQNTGPHTHRWCSPVRVRSDCTSIVSGSKRDRSSAKRHDWVPTTLPRSMDTIRYE